MPETDVLELYARKLPELFASALARLEQRASEGHAPTAALLARLVPEPVSVRVDFEGQGGGELCLLAGRQGVALAPALPASGFGHALRISARAAAYGLTSLDRGELDLEEIARGIATLGSGVARDLFTRTPFGFEIEVKDVPVLGTVRARISLGKAALPAAPEFSLSVDYDELADAREEQIGPHQLFLAGKVRIDGDVAKAMLLGMSLAQLA
jgi:hypothetical protein